MDSRYTAQGVMGIALGDAHVIRNAGGRVTDDVIRSLTLSAALLGTRACVVIHHSDCGLVGRSHCRRLDLQRPLVRPSRAARQLVYGRAHG